MNTGRTGESFTGARSFGWGSQTTQSVPILVATRNNVGMPSNQDDPQRTVAALMAASRAFVGITARSLAAVYVDVTLAQFRALTVLSTRGPQRPADISAELKVTPSPRTQTRPVPEAAREVRPQAARPSAAARNRP